MIPPVANRFVAGEHPAQALEHARELNDHGVGALLNLLGEHYDERGPAEADVATYRRLLDDLGRSALDACISVKPSQLGVQVDEAVFRKNLADVAAHADRRDAFVWVDMEDHTTVDATLDGFCDLVVDHHDMGLCLQANMKRTPADLARLADLPGKVRLVKGAYEPPRDIAYRGKTRVNEAYRDLLEDAFRTFDGGVAVGSHDPAMIEYARDLHETYGTDYEVQMLMGVREAAQTDLAREVPVYQYVPYGEKWLSYFYRRVKENTGNAAFALRAIVSG
ncbi:MAG: proline dehydrogenase family protein [Haloglomus sp.]